MIKKNKSYLTSTLARSSLFFSAIQRGTSDELEDEVRSAPLRQRHSTTSGRSWVMASSRGDSPLPVLEAEKNGMK